MEVTFYHYQCRVGLWMVPVPVYLGTNTEYLGQQVAHQYKADCKSYLEILKLGLPYFENFEKFIHGQWVAYCSPNMVS